MYCKGSFLRICMLVLENLLVSNHYLHFTVAYAICQLWFQGFMESKINNDIPKLAASGFGNPNLSIDEKVVEISGKECNIASGLEFFSVYFDIHVTTLRTDCFTTF